MLLAISLIEIKLSYTLLISGSNFNSTWGVKITPYRKVKTTLESKLYSTKSKFNSTKGVKITTTNGVEIPE